MKTFLLSLLFIVMMNYAIGQPNAGSDIQICTNTASLSGNDATAQSCTGTWTIQSGGGLLSDANLPNSNVIGLQTGQNILRWTFTGCASSGFDEIIIINNSLSVFAGTDINTGVDNAILSGSNPGLGYGYWSAIGTVVITNNTSYNTSVTNLSIGTNSFVWNVSANGCTGTDSVNVIYSPTITVDAGFDQDICTNSTTLSGTAPEAGQSGMWTVVSGSASFINESQYNTIVYNLNPSSTVLRWTITDGVSNSFDEVTILRSIPPPVFAGMDMNTCANTTSLNADPPAQGGGAWSVISGTGIFVDVNSNNTNVTGISPGENLFCWTVTFNGCTARDSVKITFNSITASAGDDKSICTNFSSLTAVDPSPNTGIWSVLSGTGTLVAPTNMFTMVTNLSPGPNIIRWTVSAGGCVDNDEVQITTNSVSTAIVGSDAETCFNNTNISANVPTQGAGMWTTNSISAKIASSSSSITNVFDLESGQNLFFWTISQNGCTSQDTIIVTNNSVQVYAGPDTTVCDSLYFPNPIFTGSCEWSVFSGSVIFYDSLNPYSPFLFKTNGPATLKLTVTSGACSATDLVNVTGYNVNPVWSIKDETQPGANDGYIAYDLKTISANYLWNTGKSFVGTKDTLKFLNEGNYSLELNIGTCKFYDVFYVATEFSGNSNCNVNASFKVIENKLNKSISLKVNTPPNPNTWISWSFGDGAFSDATNPVHTYTSDGLYDVCLSLYENENCSQTICNQVQIGTVECAAVFSNIADQINKKKIYFFDESKGNVNEWFWDFGDGTFALDKDPNHTYTLPGTYEVVMTVSNDALNCMSEYKQTVQIGIDNCIANFETVLLGAAKDSLVVINTSLKTSTKTQWYWNVDNGDTYEFKQWKRKLPAGVYQVCLSLYDDSTKCNASKCKEITIGANQFNANFAYTVTNTTKTLELTDKSSGIVSERYWTFGDGEYATAAKTSHVYAESGLYEVCLFAYNATNQLYDEKCDYIQVGINPVKAEFTSIVLDAATNKILCMDRSKGKVKSWYWDFGDGSTDTIKNPAHIYKEAGEYVITLSVADSLGTNFDFAEQSIKVGNKLLKAEYDFKVDPITRKVVFTNKSVGDAGFVFWLFDDGDFSLLPNPEHTYQYAGSYEVTLIVANFFGTRFEEITKTIQVGKVDCEAKFTTYIDKKTNKVSFINESLGKDNLYFWLFGDGGFSIEKSPVYTYKASGSFSASLILANLGGCSDSYDADVLVGGIGNDVISSFKYQAKPDSLLILFQNTSMGKIKSYLWNFGDKSDLSTLKNPKHIYSKAGVYNVCLNVVDSLGMSDMQCTEIKIAKPSELKTLCKAKFIVTPGDGDTKFKLIDKSEGNPTQWLWDFGNNITSTQPHPTINYTAKDLYMVTLTITSPTCTSNAYQVVNAGKGNVGIVGKMVTKTLPETNTKGKGYPVDLVGATFGTAAVYVWDFGDGTKDSTTSSPNHVYAKAGTYNVCLTVKDPNTKTSQTTCNQVVITSTQISDKWSNDGIHIGVYPNPMLENATIEIQTINNGNLQLNILDISGRKISELINENREAGKYSIELNKNSMKSGIYFLQLKTGNQLKTTKLIIE